MTDDNIELTQTEIDLLEEVGDEIAGRPWWEHPRCEELAAMTVDDCRRALLEWYDFLAQEGAAIDSTEAAWFAAVTDRAARSGEEPGPELEAAITRAEQAWSGLNG